jgi:hypothetical protein
MVKNRVRVWVLNQGDRVNYNLQWIDPASGRRKSKSAGTSDYEEAVRRATVLEHILNDGASAVPAVAGLPPARGPEGFVYLIAAPGGRYKLGKSVDPSGRLAALNTSSPDELTLMHRIATDDMNWLEGNLHWSLGRVVCLTLRRRRRPVRGQGVEPGAGWSLRDNYGLKIHGGTAGRRRGALPPLRHRRGGGRAGGG